MKNWSEIINLLATLLTGGFLIFVATLLVSRVTWPSWVRLVLSWVIAAVFALAAAWLHGDVWNLLTAWGNLSSADIIAFAVLLWTTATVWYKIVFKGTDWANSLKAWPHKE